MPTLTIEQAIPAAIKLHAAGKLREAEAVYRKVLAIEPNHADALNLLGVLENQSGHCEVAIELLERATRLKPTAPHFACNLGNALKTAGRMDDAIASYRRAIEIDADFAEAHYNLAGALHLLQKHEAAAESYRRAIALRPQLFEAYLNLGALLNQTGDPAAALAAYQAAIKIRPESAELRVNAANALLYLGRPDEAVANYERALTLRPDLPEALTSLAALLHDRGSLDGAVAVFKQAMRLMPDNPDLHSNLGNTLNVLGHVDEAERLCRRAIELRPELPEAWLNLGNSLGAQGRLEEALSAFAKAEEIRPQFLHAGSNRLYMTHFHADYDSAIIAEQHRRWGERHAGPLRDTIRSHDNDRDPHRRLRIGYVSPDFAQHPVGRFMLPIVQGHDRSQVEVFCYAHVGRPDAATADFRIHTDHWRDITAIPDDQAAELIRSDRIDILIDLAMHAAGNRLLIFARKPAPVQATYLAYCSTTGIDAIDYRITDPYLDPPGAPEYYSERSIRLPDCYWCYNESLAAPAVGPLPADRNGYITFGCLNSVAKLTDAAMRLWQDVLISVPDSRLIIHVHEGTHRPRILKSFAGAGVDPSRIEFVPRTNLPEYYGTYNRIDIGLDVTPYAGGTTTCDALWMGVPVITLAGRTAVGRGGVSILSNLRLRDLIGNSPAEYVSIATTLSMNRRKIAELRSTLRERMLKSPLMNQPLFTRNLEAVYRTMWLAQVAEQGR